MSDNFAFRVISSRETFSSRINDISYLINQRSAMEENYITE